MAFASRNRPICISCPKSSPSVSTVSAIGTSLLLIRSPTRHSSMPKRRNARLVEPIWTVPSKSSLAIQEPAPSWPCTAQTVRQSASCQNKTGSVSIDYNKRPKRCNPSRRKGKNHRVEADPVGKNIVVVVVVATRSLHQHHQIPLAGHTDQPSSLASPDKSHKAPASSIRHSDDICVSTSVASTRRCETSSGRYIAGPPISLR